jgi:cyclopropane fatty-acyl-phospholipid synthase-like methyltransferase
MISKTENITGHYSQGDLLQKIHDGVKLLGKSSESVSTTDLGPVDEFHIGGRAATENLLMSLQLQPETKILDVGCGIGGASRYIAETHGANVVGIDLTSEYIDVGTELNSWLGLCDRITLVKGSAIQMPFEELSFENCIMLHVGMNVQDKLALFKEVFRVLAHKGRFAVYDIVSLKDAQIQFPLPWASDSESSFLTSVDTYEELLVAAGFSIESVENRGDFAKEFFAKMKKLMSSGDWPPPLGLHILMGMNAPEKYGNMMTGVLEGEIAPVKVIAKKS